MDKRTDTGHKPRPKKRVSKAEIKPKETETISPFAPETQPEKEIFSHGQ